jgi:uracil-DNA glycosylase
LKNIQLRIPFSWSNGLNEEFHKDYFIHLNETVTKFYAAETKRVFPPEELIFRAFDLCSFEKLKVVILGQDPYPTLGNANGLSFSVADSVKVLPKSLKNIFLEVQEDLKIEFPKNGNLERWANQGVLMLNSILTVDEGSPNSHKDIGWEKFTDAVIHKISTEKSQLVFLLWGTKAIAKKEIIDCKKHLVLTAPHPSPLSAYRGFFGCKHFSQTNQYFRKLGITEINW